MIFEQEPLTDSEPTKTCRKISIQSTSKPHTGTDAPSVIMICIRDDCVSIQVLEKVHGVGSKPKMARKPVSI